MFAAKLSQFEESRGRSAERYRLQLRTTGGGSPVVVHDLSSSGILVEVDEPVDLGSEIELDLPGCGPVAAEIVWSSGHYFGGQFRKPLPAGAVSAAIAESRIVWPDFARKGPEDRVDHDADVAPIDEIRPIEGMSGRARMGVILGSSALLWGLIALAI